MERGTRIIGLTRGKSTVVSYEDYAYLTQWVWYANSYKSGIYYAVRKQHFSTIIGKQKQTTILMHRVIMERVLDYSDFEEVDHIDGDGLNNCRSNLRPVTHKQNLENRRLNKNNKSGVRGVSWNKRARKWRAYVMSNGIEKHLGFFTRLEEAEKAVIAARGAYFTHNDADKVE